MLIDRYLRVQCINKRCPRPAAADVPVPEVAPNVLALPARLRCKTCDHDVKVIDDAPQP